MNNIIELYRGGRSYGGGRRHGGGGRTYGLGGRMYSRSDHLYRRYGFGVNSDNYYEKFTNPPKRIEHTQTSTTNKLGGTGGAFGFGWGNNLMYPIVVAPSEVISISKI